MIPQQYREMLSHKSVIRQISEYGAARAAEVGAENVFDYSLGNPSVPAPAAFTAEMQRLLAEAEPVALHGYSPSLGIPAVRAAVAESLARRFGLPYEARHIFMTSGAAGAIAHALRAVCEPGDEVVTFAPCFPEYGPYVAGAGLRLRYAASRADLQPDLESLAALLGPKTAAVLINTPNNPTGAVYSAESLAGLAEVLRAGSARRGRPIYLISDEPYREIDFTGAAPYVASFYKDTLTCYSFSKSLSLPGERIGYLAVRPGCEGEEVLADICGQISRGTGHNCPPSIIQLAVAKVLERTADLSVYRTNMELMYAELTALGFDCQKPGGTFYIFPKALEPDAVAFCERAKRYDLLLVPSDSFGCKGYFRMALCTDTDKVRRSLPALRALAESYR